MKIVLALDGDDGNWTARVVKATKLPPGWVGRTWGPLARGRSLAWTLATAFNGWRKLQLRTVSCERCGATWRAYSRVETGPDWCARCKGKRRYSKRWRQSLPQRLAKVRAARARWRVVDSGEEA